ncbi:MAG: carbohydrate kinase family protein [Candidatus Kerfeldbacteria bacterium]|nr:carbohydrate kinase family protein [Candidatus Kerfeldbacteria bacterium]
MKHHILTIGGATWDVLLTTNECYLLPGSSRKLLGFPYGGKVDVSNAIYGFGGGAANVAVGLSKLSLKTSIITRLGNDWRGHEVIKNLQHYKIDATKVQKDKKMVTPLSFVITSCGPRDHVVFVDRGASQNLQIPYQPDKTATWLYLTSLATPTWRVSLSKLFRASKAKGVKVFWNPGSKQLHEFESLKKLLPYVTILDVNKEEAESLAHKKTSVPDLLKYLKSLGPQAALITAGAAGAYYFDGNQILYHAALKVKPVNTTGAGDAFGSGFLAGLIQTGEAKKALHWGMLNSSSVITDHGAQKGLLSLKAITG